jgi:hypothetical protein
MPRREQAAAGSRCPAAVASGAELSLLALDWPAAGSVRGAGQARDEGHALMLP